MSKRKFQVEVLVEIEIDGDEETASQAVDGIMQRAWNAHEIGIQQFGTGLAGPRWHFEIFEGGVGDITEDPADEEDQRILRKFDG